MNDKLRVDYFSLLEGVADCLKKTGLNSTRATIEAQIFTESDLLGVPSHGVRRLPPLLTAIAEGRVNPAPEEQVIQEMGAISITDCDNGPGRYAALHAMNKAIAQAAVFGVGVCLAKNTSHWGRGHAYASRAAEKGYIGICTTNAIPSMAAWGATNKVIGNNPLAIAVPGIKKEQPVVLDIAMSQASVGKVATFMQDGVELSDPLGFDSKGRLSTDPKAILAGAVAPMGAHKGEGLALMMELLTATLAGANLGYQLASKDQSGIDANATKTFIALNVEAFTPLEDYRNNLKTLLSQLKLSTPAFCYPGERGWRAKAQNTKQGVPIHLSTLEELSKIGIDLPTNQLC